MDHDVVIIGAGMSGLAAGIRLAQYDKKVCIIEKHEQFGGLNSFYRLDGRKFDVGLHALTNFVKPNVRNAPLNKLLRQLRIPYEVLELCEQNYSAVAFPGRKIRFANHIELMIGEVRREFPSEIDGFMKLLEAVKSYDDLNLSPRLASSRKRLAEFLHDGTLIDMLLCPLMYYGNAQEHDMDWTQLVIMFKSIYLEGFARPRQGVRRVVVELVKRYRDCGGQLKMQCGVEKLKVQNNHVNEIVLENGEQITAKIVLSSAGYVETMSLCGNDFIDSTRHAGCYLKEIVGQLSFMESISILKDKPADFGMDATIIFFNDAEIFTYAKPDELIDPRSGVICCPNNYQQHDDLEGAIRLTSIANYDGWVSLPEAQYKQAKLDGYDQAADHAVKFMPEFRDRVVYREIFTPRTIKHYTGHLNGAVYGSTKKFRDGRTAVENLFIIGTDQGFLGIVGAILSGISMANLHVLSASEI